MVKISLIITSFKDPRVFNLVEQLLPSNPYEIIIADGGTSGELLEKFRALESDTVKFYTLPGNIAETRYQVQDIIKGDISVFIDTDELPTDKWLLRLTNPIVYGEYDFAFGSTRPLEPPDSIYSKYLADYDEFLYSTILKNDILKGAMGNSAWRTEIIQKIGFDPCLGIGGEDYDLTIRAVLAGYKGKYVSNAVLLHDQNGIRTLRKFLKKMFYNYMVGASLAYRKSGMLFSRAGKSAEANRKFHEPLEIMMFLLKPVALLFSLMLNPWEDHRLCKHTFININKEKVYRR